VNDDETPDQSERAAIDELDAVLADHALWVEPPADLQEQIVAAIADARGPRRSRPVWYAIVVTAAALLLAAGVVIGVNVIRDDAPIQYAASLTGTELAPSASGEVTLTKTASGWKVHLHATGLPRRDNGEYYEAWLKSSAGVLVPVGTFNEFGDVTLWSGVPPSSHPTFTVTRQLANGNPASSRQVVLSGATHRTH
jgi:hypothetical protein